MMHTEIVVTILLMGLGTAASRLGGFWFMGKVKMSPFVKRWLETLPGALILAIVTPSILTGSFIEPAAAGGVIVTMILTRNLLLAMVAGSALIFALRSIF